MSSEQITVWNTLSYSLSTCILASVFFKGSLRKHIVALGLLLLLAYLLRHNSNLTMPANVLLLAGYFSPETKQLRKVFCLCLTVVFLLWCGTVVLASIVMIVAPGWHGGTGFNLFMGEALLLLSLLAKRYSRLLKAYAQLEHFTYPALIQILIFLFFSLVLPQYVSSVAKDDLRLWGVFSLAFMILMALVGLLLNRMKNLEHERREYRLQTLLQQEYAEQVRGQFEATVKLHHYYNRLFHSLAPLVREYDVGSRIRQYFEKHIAPVHRRHLQTAAQLSNVESDLLRNLLDITAGQAAKQDEYSFELSIDGRIRIPDSMETDVFEILTNLIDNAFHALEGQTEGLMQIALRGNREVVSILVMNTIAPGMRIEEIYTSETEGGGLHGHGLRRVREIVYQCPGMEHFTYKGNGYLDRDTLVQRIQINLEGRDDDVWFSGWKNHRSACSTAGLPTGRSYL